MSKHLDRQFWLGTLSGGLTGFGTCLISPAAEATIGLGAAFILGAVIISLIAGILHHKAIRDEQP